MRSYQLYLIEDEFASHYFGREQGLFQLFLEKERSKGELKAIIEKQIQFITKPISSLRVQKLIHKKIGKANYFRFDNGVYYIEGNSLYSNASLEVFERNAMVNSKGNFDAETILFEVLRQCETSFLAIDLEHHRYGWLNPIKQRKFI